MANDNTTPGQEGIPLPPAKNSASSTGASPARPNAKATTPQPAPQPAGAPSTAPQTPPVQQSTPQPAAQAPKTTPVTTANQQPQQQTSKTAGTRRPPDPKRLIWGCTGCGSLAVLFFVILALIFVSQTTATGENPFASALGLSPSILVSTLITLVNLIFGAITLILFVVGVFGIFRFFMANKADKIARKRGLSMAGISGGLLVLIVFIWIAVFLFMSSRPIGSDIPVSGILTDPAQPLNLTAPVTVTFDASNLPISTRQYDIVSYLWDFGDGKSSTVALTSNTYTSQGTFNVRLNVTKRDITTAEQSTDVFETTVSVANVELAAIFTATPERGPAPLTVTFDASESVAPAGQIVGYEWDLTNNNVFNDAQGVRINHVFEQVGNYTVNLRVRDNTGQFKTVSKQIVVSDDDAPTAVIQIPTSDGNFYVGQQYSFQGDQSTSPTSSIQQYEWDFGDGSSKASTRTATHVYGQAGQYQVTLTVTDQAGRTAEATETITIQVPESAPIAVIKTTPAPEGDEEAIEGTVPFEVSFDGSGSQDPDDNIVDYRWDFDGDGQEDAAGDRTIFVFKEEGVYNSTLTVVDAEGNEAKSIIVVKVNAQPLQARITADPIEGVVPLTVTFDASSSSYPSGQIVSYEWEFGDGTPKRIDTSTVTYKYTQIGTFTAAVTAIASDGSRSTTELSINVRPVPLSACYEALPTSGEAPLEVEFDPHCSTGTIAKYSWDFGDGETTKTRKPTHVFNQPGSYEVILEVTDNQGVLDTFSQNILVTGSVSG